MPSAYNEFVKKHMLAMRGDKATPAKDKMKHIAGLWRESKGMKAEVKKGKKGKKADGGSFLSDIADGVKGSMKLASLFGGDMPKPRKPRAKKVVKGAGLLSDIGSIGDNVFGLGLPEKKVRKARKAKAVKGGDFLNDAWDGFSKGFLMPFNAVSSVASLI